jgi:hypothetical protein
MKSFKQFIIESKNTHLEHLEDELWNAGSKGVANAIAFLRGVSDTLSSTVSSSHNVTVKWDGAPAIFVGINPENNKFFVGTKSVFNKGTPKINYTNADIDKNHPASGLNSKLKIALKYLSGLGIKGILQGDFMFDSKSLGSMSIDGEKQTTFTPNTITYAVPVGSDLEKQIKSAKMGIVFHTGYKGRKMEDMKAFFRPSLKSLKKTKDVWFRDADFTDSSGAVTLTTSESDALDAEIQSASDHMRNAGKLIDNLRDSVKPHIKAYINSTIRAGESNGSFGGFIAYLTDKLNTAIDKLKTEKGREKKAVARDEVLEYLNTNKDSISSMFDAHKALTKAKIILIRKLEKIKGIGTFVRTDDGFRATAPEGFVAVDDTGKALKLVDRLEFSRSNFTVAKNWVKG